MCIVCIANNINRNVYMYLPTTGYARVLLFMFIRRELAEERYRMFISVYIGANFTSRFLYAGKIRTQCFYFDFLFALIYFPRVF